MGDFATEEMAAETVKSRGVDPGRAEELVTLLDPAEATEVLSAALGFLVRSPSPVATGPAQGLLFHENATVRRQSLYLLASLLGREGLPWYVKCAQARVCRGTTDLDAWEFILRHGDESVAVLVAGWVGKKIGKGKGERVDLDGQSSRTRALIFLARYPENQRVQEVFAKAEEHEACFSQEEAAWLSERVPAFPRRTALAKPPIQVPVPQGHPVLGACETGDLEVVRAYLDRGGRSTAAKTWGSTPPRRWVQIWDVPSPCGPCRPTRKRSSSS